MFSKIVGDRRRCIVVFENLFSPSTYIYEHRTMREEKRRESGKNSFLEAKNGITLFILESVRAVVENIFTERTYSLINVVNNQQG